MKPPRISAETRHRIHSVLVMAHQRRQEGKPDADSLVLDPQFDPAHEVTIDRDTRVHVWVVRHPEAGWCHRVRLERPRIQETSGLPRLANALMLLGLRPLVYDFDAVWRAKDQSLHVMQPIQRPRFHA